MSHRWNSPEHQRRRAEFIERQRIFGENVQKSEANLKAQQEQHNQFLSEMKQFKIEETNRLKELEEAQFKQQEDMKLLYQEEDRRRIQLDLYKQTSTNLSSSLQNPCESNLFY